MKKPNPIWIVDTVKMTVTCPEERLRWIKAILKGDPKKITKKFVRSVAGLLEFLAAVLLIRLPRFTFCRRGMDRKSEGIQARLSSALTVTAVIKVLPSSLPR